MTVGPMRNLTIALLVTALAPSVALATPPAKLGACGVKILPLAVGNTWRYANVATVAKIDDKIAKVSPAPFESIVITVKSIEPKGTDTLVTLEETLTSKVNQPPVGGKPVDPKLAERKLTTTITCNAKKFDISPDSFLFAGEPGGQLNVTFDKIERSRGTSWTLTNGTIGEAEWREDVVAHWIRKPSDKSGLKETTGKLELERKFTPQQPEAIGTKAGTYGKTEKLALVTTGRITLDQAHPDNKPMELPAGWLNTLWLADGVGLVQALNGYAHQYQLVEVTLK